MYEFQSQKIDWRIDDWDKQFGILEPTDPQYRRDQLRIIIDKPEKPSPEQKIVFNFSSSLSIFAGYRVNIEITIFSEPDERNFLKGNKEFEVTCIPFEYDFPTINYSTIKKILHVNIAINILKSLKTPKSRKAEGVSGLRNVGNTCYINAIIQILFHIPEFRRIIFSINIPNLNTPWNKFMYSLQKLFYQMKSGDVCQTSEFAEAIGLSAQELRRQQDALEFLCLLLDHILQEIHGTAAEQRLLSLLSLTVETTRVSGGAAETAVESMMQLSVRAGSADTLRGEIDRVLEAEMIDGENGPIVQTKRLASLPPVLLVCLEAVEFDREAQSPQKSAARQEVPLRLDLSDLVAGAEYELAGVVFHAGTASLGHYFAFVRPGRGGWVRVDDAAAMEATEADVCGLRGSKQVIRSRSQAPARFAAQADGRTAPSLLAFVRAGDAESVLGGREDGEPAYLASGELPAAACARVITIECVAAAVAAGRRAFSGAPATIPLPPLERRQGLYEEVAKAVGRPRVRLWQVVNGSPTRVLPAEGRLLIDDLGAPLFADPIGPNEALSLRSQEMLRVLACIFTPGGWGSLRLVKPAYVSPRFNADALRADISRTDGTQLAGAAYVDNLRERRPRKVEKTYFEAGTRECSLVIFTASAPSPLQGVRTHCGLPLLLPPSHPSVSTPMEFYEVRFLAADLCLFAFGRPGPPAAAVTVPLDMPRDEMFAFFARAAGLQRPDNGLVLFDAAVAGAPNPRPLETAAWRTASGILVKGGESRGALYISPCPAGCAEHAIVAVASGPDAERLLCLHFPRAPSAEDIFDAAGLDPRSFRLLLATAGNVRRELLPGDVLDDFLVVLALPRDAPESGVRCFRALWHDRGRAVSPFGVPFFVRPQALSELRAARLVPEAEVVAVDGTAVIEKEDLGPGDSVAFVVDGSGIVFPRTDMNTSSIIRFNSLKCL